MKNDLFFFSEPKTSDIRWVLTVPAIWTDESKGFMRQVALNVSIQTNILVSYCI